MPGVRLILILAGAWVLAGSGAANAHEPQGAMGGRAIASAGTSAQMIAARKRFFGAENVDPATGAVRPDRAIFSWYGVTNFALALRGHVVLLDAWVARGAHSGYIPTTPEELASLRPELILLGHAHFDHAADAVPLALASGATLAGTAEHCADLRARSPVMPPNCVSVLPAGAAPGTRREADLLEGVEIVAVKHLHSGATRPDGSDTGGYHVPVAPLPSLTLVDRPPTPDDVAHLVDHAPDDEGGSVLYRFRTGGMSFVWHDTSGPLIDNAPATYEAFRALRPVDVEVGAIQGFNQLTNGMRDARQYIDALAPKVFVPTHHDDWLTVITTNGEAYRQPFYAELERLPPERRPQVRFIVDPQDYVRPEALTFPLKLESPRLVRACRSGGRLRARLAGGLVQVRAVRFYLDARRQRAVRRHPFAAVFTRRQLAATRSRRLRATVTLFDGRMLRLSRALPRCRRAAGPRPQ